MKTVLLVDDCDETRLTTKWFLNNFGYEVQCARSGGEALTVFDPSLHDIVVTDNSMPGMSGAEMAHVIKLRSPSTPVLMFSGRCPGNQSCLDGFVQKPAHPIAVSEAVARLLAVK